jgi:hypothetical protein
MSGDRVRSCRSIPSVMGLPSAHGGLQIPADPAAMQSFLNPFPGFSLYESVHQDYPKDSP